MALLPTKQRDQAMLFVIIAAVAALGLYYMYVWSPKQDELTKVQAHVDSLELLNAETKREVASGNAASLKRQADAYTRDLDALRHLVPTGNEVPALLESVSNASRQAGLDLAEVIPEGVTQGDQFDTYRYKLGVSGPYHKIAEFLANVGSLPRIVAPMNLTLVQSQRNDIKPKKNDTLLDARFEIETYVAHGAPVKGVANASAGAP